MHEPGTFAVIPAALGRRALLCLAAEVQASMDELRAKAQTSPQFIHLAFLVLLIKRS